MRKIPWPLLEILLKIVSFHLKLEIKYTQTSKKETFHKQSVVILLKNGCSVRHMFCTNLFIYLWPKFFKNTFEVVHTSNWSCSRKTHIRMDNLLNGYFYYNYFGPNFSKQYFPELHLNGKLFCTIQTCHVRLPLAEAEWELELGGFIDFWPVFFIRKYFWKTSLNKHRGKFTTSATSKTEFFVTLCQKEIHYRCCVGPRYASETSY